MRFLLVHGSCHGAWCWREVIPLLEAAGHKVAAIDLPDGDVTLDDYADAVLGGLPEPSVVVGHSSGGYAISAAALKDASRMQRLIFVAGYVPAEGKSLADRRAEVEEQPLLPAFVKSPDGKAISFDLNQTKAKLYHDCSDDQIAFANARLRSQPILPQRTPVHLTAEWHAIQKSYVLCADDRAVPPALQRQMASVLAPDQVRELPSGHSPFFSMPERLAEVLIGLSEQV